MGVEPVSGTIIGLGLLAGAALALYVEECERENERRRQEEDSRRRQREQKERKARREREARRERKREEQERVERERRENEDREAIFQMRLRQRQLEIKREQEEAEQRRINRSWNTAFDGRSYYDPFQTSGEYYRSQLSYSFLTEYEPEENRFCRCVFCTVERENRASSCTCSRCNPLSTQQRSVSVTFTPPAITQTKNQNATNQRSSSTSVSSSAQSAGTSGSASKQNASASSSSSQSQRNNNNNNNNDKNNDKKDSVEDYGTVELNDFIKILKAVLDRCNASKELRDKILSFFKNFMKHEENFLTLLRDFRTQNIAIEDILSIVIRLFQSEYFAQDIAYAKFLALLEIVAKYIKDELIYEMVEDSIRGSKKPHEQQREECMKKVLQRDNILSEITDSFERARKEIVEDNASRPLNPDFSGIFAKVYHYIKHKVARGKEWTVKEYFDWIRKLLDLLKNVKPEYVELTNVDYNRREIVFEMYSTVYQGYFRLVVRAYGPTLNICTFYFREKRDKKAKDGDTYIDGKKKS